jgi:hypothetical protein
LSEDICCCFEPEEKDKKESYLTIAIANITLRNNLPANQVWGMKYFRNPISSILRMETIT